MLRILLLHGFVGHRGIHFFPFLRDRYGSRCEVLCPSLPNPSEPSLEEWSRCVSGLIGAPEVDITICHSLGGTLAMSMISRGKLRTRALVTIGSSHGPKNEDVMNNFLEPPLLVSRLRQIEKFYAVASWDDPWTYPEYSILLVKQCGAVGLFYANQGHFETETLPREVLDLVDRLCTDFEEERSA